MSSTQENIKYPYKANQLALGVFGFDTLQAGTYNTQEYHVIFAYTDLTVTVINSYDEGTESTLTIPAGLPLYGGFTSIVVATGTGVAYLSKPRVV